MTDFLLDIYPWVKSLHIMSVISWMAGLFYFPRLLVNHVEEATAGDQVDLVLQRMEEKLYRIIMNPAMIATWVFGLALVFTPGIVDWGDVWPYLKTFSVITMTWFHFWLGNKRKSFVTGTNTTSSRNFRLMNEVPTVLMMIIVFSVVVKFSG
ncbi:MAG: CopD family protein [Rhodobacterales bacterium]|nr:CopD family protein [Rhodobacterales bacterium]